MKHRFLLDAGEHFSERTEHLLARYHARRSDRFHRVLFPWLVLFGIVAIRAALVW